MGFSRLPSTLAGEEVESVEKQTLSYFRTRGVVADVYGLETLDWPQRARDAGLTTIGAHVTPSQVARFIQSEAGQTFLANCKNHNIQVEHELHAMSDLLPREYYIKDKTMFRMTKDGERTADYNCCVHSKPAVEIICENAVQYAAILPSTTGRYFYWIDDGMPMCYCPQCRIYSDSDQALILENHILSALKTRIPYASLAHLAYLNTIMPPQQVKPENGIFLEFAPIRRTWDHPLQNRDARKDDQSPTHGQILDCLDANLEYFGREHAQVLEYWTDVSLFSHWKKPAKRLPWTEEVFLSDLQTYGKRGVRHITSFVVYIDADYIRQYGEPPLDRYGRGLLNYHFKTM